MAQQYDGSIRIDTKINQAGFNKGIAGIQGSVNRLGASLKSLAKTIGAAFGVAKIVQFGKEAISLASDLNEVQNVVETAFGGMSTQVDAWAKNSIKQFGMSELAAKRMASTYMSMSVGSGLQGQGAADMAMKTAERAADISSFYNKSLEESDTMLKSIWTGETESLKQIGVVMTQTNLDAFAMANGFGKTTREMTQGEQIMLRYQYVMNQTRLAAGDFVKTQDSWANQTKVLSEQWKQFMSVVGDSLIQVLTPALQILNQFLAQLVQWATTLNEIIKSLFGGSAGASGAGQTAMAGAAASAGILAGSTEDAATAQDDLAGSTADANKQLKEQIKNFSGLDEISTFATQKISGGAGSDIGGIGGSVSIPSFSGEIGQDVKISPNLQKTIDTIQKWFEDIKKAAKPATDAMTRLWDELKRMGTEFIWPSLVDFYETFLKPLGEWTMGEAFPRFIDAISNGLAQIDYQTLLDSLHNLWSALEPFAENVGEGLLWLWENVLVPLATWTISEVLPRFLNILADAISFLNTVIEELKPLGEWLWNNFLKPLSEFAGWVIVEFLIGISQWFERITEVLVGLKNVIEFISTKAVPWLNKQFVNTVKGIMNAWKGVGDFFVGVWNSIKGAFSHVADWFKDVFSKAWQGVKNVFSTGGKIFNGIKEGIANTFKTVVNGLIFGINKIISVPFDTINGMLNSIRDINIMGFKPFEGLWGYNPLYVPQIPYLAQGAVIPPNQQFLAVLGDQKKGNNLEGPESMFRQIVREESGNGSRNTYTVNAQVGRKTLFQLVIDEAKMTQARTGKNPFVLA